MLWYVTSSVRVFGFYLPYIYLFGFALAVALVVVLYLILYRTRFWPQRPGHHAGPDRIPAHRDQRQPGSPRSRSGSASP